MHVCLCVCVCVWVWNHVGQCTRGWRCHIVCSNVCGIACGQVTPLWLLFLQQATVHEDGAATLPRSLPAPNTTSGPWSASRCLRQQVLEACCFFFFFSFYYSIRSVLFFPLFPFLFNYRYWKRVVILLNCPYTCVDKSVNFNELILSDCPRQKRVSWLKYWHCCRDSWVKY